MYKRVDIGFAALFLVMIPSTLAQTPPSSRQDQGLEMIISVHNLADVPIALLDAAENQAREIYRRAGIETVWLNCSPKLEATEPASCYLSDSAHLTLKISPREVTSQVRDRLDVLGLSPMTKAWVTSPTFFTIASETSLHGKIWVRPCLPG